MFPGRFIYALLKFHKWVYREQIIGCVILLELFALYVIFFYGNDNEVYILIFRVGISLVLVMVGESGLLGIIVITLSWPGYLVYIL
jgi:hypothetical protein